MNIISYKEINFTNGKKLQIPLLDDVQSPYREEIDVGCACCLFSCMLGNYSGIYGGDWRSEFYLLPKGYANAYIDLDGGHWYYNYNESGDSFILELYVRDISIFTVSGNKSALNAQYSYFAYAFCVTWSQNVIVRSVSQERSYTLGRNYLDNVRWETLLSSPTLFPADLYYNYKRKAGNGFGFCNFFNNVSPNYDFTLAGTLLDLPYTSLPNSLVNDIEPEPYDSDTNSEGGYSTIYTGGNGNFDRTSDTIAVPQLPTLNATNAGFVTLYKPTLGQLVSLADYMWSNNILNILISYFSNPMDIIIGLGIVPVSAPANSTGYPSAGTITIPLELPIYDSQYYTLDCGSIDIKEFWGSALDYAPYTKISIYLPYVGVRVIDTDEVMGHTVGVIYHIDLFGGACMAFVTVDGSAKYQFSGECLQQIPINAANYDQLVQNLVSLACVVGSGIAAAGSTGAAAAVAEESKVLGAGSLNTPQAMGKGFVGSEYAEFRGMGAKEWLADGGGKSLMNCTVSTVMASKPTVERTGSMGATTGQLSVQTPYLIIERPEQSLPENYRHYAGYPSNITSKLGDLDGFTVVDSIRLNDLAATQPELIEIYSLLKKGVII